MQKSSASYSESSSSSPCSLAVTSFCSSKWHRLANLLFHLKCDPFFNSARWWTRHATVFASSRKHPMLSWACLPQLLMQSPLLLRNKLGHSLQTSAWLKKLGTLCKKKLLFLQVLLSSLAQINRSWKLIVSSSLLKRMGRARVRGGAKHRSRVSSKSKWTQLLDQQALVFRLKTQLWRRKAKVSLPWLE